MRQMANNTWEFRLFPPCAIGEWLNPLIFCSDARVVKRCENVAQQHAMRIARNAIVDIGRFDDVDIADCDDRQSTCAGRLHPPCYLGA